jgi:hypothetical protein
MRELLEQLAATRPLVLILDDVHWLIQPPRTSWSRCSIGRRRRASCWS